MAGTVNAFNNQINGSYNQIILNAGTNGVAISTDASAATVNVATGGAVKTATFGSTNSTSATTVQSGSGALAVTSTNGTLTINSGTGALSISNDASATTVTIATGGAVKTTTLGSTNSTSATTVQSGSGALNITSTNGAITMNSGTGTVAIGNDATAATYNFATGAGAKVVTVGSTNGASSLALKCGTADFSLASATGTIITALDTGEITNPLQPAFLAVKSGTTTNVTGAGTLYTYICDTEKYDVNSDYDTGTGTFTAPVTGKYFLAAKAVVVGCTIASGLQLRITTSNNNFTYNNNRGASANNYDWAASISCDMDSADTAIFKILTSGEAGDTDDVYGDGTTDGTACNGWLLG